MANRHLPHHQDDDTMDGKCQTTSSVATTTSMTPSISSSTTSTTTKDWSRDTMNLLRQCMPPVAVSKGVTTLTSIRINCRDESLLVISCVADVIAASLRSITPALTPYYFRLCDACDHVSSQWLPIDVMVVVSLLEASIYRRDAWRCLMSGLLRGSLSVTLIHRIMNDGASITLTSGSEEKTNIWHHRHDAIIIWIKLLLQHLPAHVIPGKLPTLTLSTSLLLDAPLSSLSSSAMMEHPCRLRSLIQWCHYLIPLVFRIVTTCRSALVRLLIDTMIVSSSSSRVNAEPSNGAREVAWHQLTQLIHQYGGSSSSSSSDLFHVNNEEWIKWLRDPLLDNSTNNNLSQSSRARLASFVCRLTMMTSPSTSLSSSSSSSSGRVRDGNGDPLLAHVIHALREVTSDDAHISRALIMANEILLCHARADGARLLPRSLISIWRHVFDWCKHIYRLANTPSSSSSSTMTGASPTEWYITQRLVLTLQLMSTNAHWLSFDVPSIDDPITLSLITSQHVELFLLPRHLLVAASAASNADSRTPVTPPKPKSRLKKRPSKIHTDNGEQDESKHDDNIPFSSLPSIEFKFEFKDPSAPYVLWPTNPTLMTKIHSSHGPAAGSRHRLLAYQCHAWQLMLTFRSRCVDHRGDDDFLSMDDDSSNNASIGVTRSRPFYHWLTIGYLMPDMNDDDPGSVINYAWASLSVYHLSMITVHTIYQWIRYRYPDNGTRSNEDEEEYYKVIHMIGKRMRWTMLALDDANHLLNQTLQPLDDSTMYRHMITELRLALSIHQRPTWHIQLVIDVLTYQWTKVAAKHEHHVAPPAPRPSTTTDNNASDTNGESKRSMRSSSSKNQTHNALGPLGPLTSSSSLVSSSSISGSVVLAIPRTDSL
jgi:hypothetical protein